jgi:DNA-binding protein YbaB
MEDDTINNATKQAGQMKENLKKKQESNDVTRTSCLPPRLSSSTSFQ